MFLLLCCHIFTSINKSIFYSNFQDFVVSFEFQTWTAQVGTSDWVQQTGGKNRLFQLQVTQNPQLYSVLDRLILLHRCASYRCYLTKVSIDFWPFDIFLTTLWWLAFDHCELRFSHFFNFGWQIKPQKVVRNLWKINHKLCQVAAVRCAAL